MRARPALGLATAALLIAASRRRDLHHPSRRPPCTLRHPPPEVNPIVVENRLPGTSAWRIPWSGRTVADDRTLAIKGYATAGSVEKSQSVGIRVHAATAGPASYGVYRLGWYQGLGGRQMTSGTFTAVRQPACTTEMPIGLISCPWNDSFTVQTEADWTSGVYVVVLTRGTAQSYASFVVRDDLRTGALVHLQPTLTSQAYNNFPNNGTTGKSLYAFNSFGAITLNGSTSAVKASFDRPYANSGAGDVMIFEAPDGALRRVARLRRHVRDRHGPARRPRAPHRPGGASLGRPRRVLDERDVQRGRAGARRGCRPRVPRRERRLLAGADGAVCNRSARSGDGCLPRGEPRSRHGRFTDRALPGTPATRAAAHRADVADKRLHRRHARRRAMGGSAGGPLVLPRDRAGQRIEDPAARRHRGRPSPPGVPRPGDQGGHDPGRARRLDVRDAHRQQHRAAGVHAVPGAVERLGLQRRHPALHARTARRGPRGAADRAHHDDEPACPLRGYAARRDDRPCRRTRPVRHRGGALEARIPRRPRTRADRVPRDGGELPRRARGRGGDAGRRTGAAGARVHDPAGRARRAPSAAPRPRSSSSVAVRSCRTA